MSQTADRYSNALFELAHEQNILGPVHESMMAVENIMDGSEDFRSFLDNPLLSYEESGAVLRALFEGKVPELLLRFFLFVTYKKRLDILRDIIESFDGLYLDSTHQMRAYVQTALPVKEEDQAFIDQRLKDKFQQKVLTAWVVDPSLIGGFRIFAQGKLYDYSFKDQLDQFLQRTTQPV